MKSNRRRFSALRRTPSPSGKRQLNDKLDGPGFDTRRTPDCRFYDRTCVTLASRYNPAGKIGPYPDFGSLG